MSKVLEKVEELRGMAVSLFLEAHDLAESLEAEGLSLEDARDSLKAIGNTQNVLHDAEHRLKRISARLDLCLTYQYENRLRLYVIRRETRNLGNWLTWDEINQGSSKVLNWDDKSFYLLDVARKSRDSHNTMENDPKRAEKVRGFQIGEHTWQIWSYDSSNNSWKLVD